MALVGDAVDAAVGAVAVGVAQVVLQVADDRVLPVDEPDGAVRPDLQVGGAEVCVGGREDRLQPMLLGEHEHTIDDKGRSRCVYRRYQTPLETLLALPQPAQYLRPGLTPAVLQRIAATRSDTEAAQRMQQAKRKLFEQLQRPANGPWK